MRLDFKSTAKASIQHNKLNKRTKNAILESFAVKGFARDLRRLNSKGIGQD